MAPSTIPLTLKLQNGAITYFISIHPSATFKDLASNLTEVINSSGGYIKNAKALPIEDVANDIDIPKPSFNDGSSEEEDDSDNEVANATTTTNAESEGVQIVAESLKFAISKNRKIELENLVLIEDQNATLQSQNIKDYSQILFALQSDEFDVIEPVSDRDDE